MLLCWQSAPFVLAAGAAVCSPARESQFCCMLGDGCVSPLKPSASIGWLQHTQDAGFSSVCICVHPSRHHTNGDVHNCEMFWLLAEKAYEMLHVQQSCIFGCAHKGKWVHKILSLQLSQCGSVRCSLGWMHGAWDHAWPSVWCWPLKETGLLIACTFEGEGGVLNGGVGFQGPGGVGMCVICAYAEALFTVVRLM